jgi:hypothetical protein
MPQIAQVLIHTLEGHLELSCYCMWTQAVFFSQYLLCLKEAGLLRNFISFLHTLRIN